MTTPRHEELLARTREWVAVHNQAGLAGPLDFADDTDLVGAAILDSVGFIELLAYVESLVGRELDLEDVDPSEITRLGGLCAFALATPATETAHVR